MNTHTHQDKNKRIYKMTGCCGKVALLAISFVGVAKNEHTTDEVKK
jgi:hypothetical protein